MATVLAAGPGAVLSHRSAGAFYEICRESSCTEVSGRRGRRLPIERDEWETVDGIAVTTPARTLFDLAAVLKPEHLEHAFNQAEYHRLTSPVSLDVLLARHPRRPGARELRLDGGSHRTYARFHDDRSRDRANLVDGWPTVRVTSRHLDVPEQRAELAADLRRLLRPA